MIRYSPGIHGFVPMLEATEAALWNLWNSHPEHPYLSLCCMTNKSPGSSLSAGIPDIIFASPVGRDYKTMTLEEAREELDEAALSHALLCALSDRWVTEFADDFQRATSALSLKYGYLTLHVMPGCLMLQNVDPAIFIEDYVKDDWGDDYIELWNLGIFAAGPTETAHEQVAAISAVQAVRSAWQCHVDTVNEAIPSKIQMSDPIIHPGRQDYC